MWSNDTRLREGPGRYEHRLIGAALSPSATVPIAGANPNRVALVLTATFNAPTFGDGVFAGPISGASVIGIVSCTPENPVSVVRFCDCGDALWQAVFLEVIGAGALTVRALEVIWHPAEIK